MTRNARLSVEVSGAITRALNEQRIVGAVVLVAHDGETVFEHAAGLANREAGTPMAIDTLFRLASVTKAIVAAAAMTLIERGTLSLDSSVTQWLPEFQPALPSGESPQMTIRHLLTHTAGLDYRFQQPADGPYVRANISDGLDQPGLSMQEHIARVASVPLVNPPGVVWRYSVAMEVLGAVMERAEGKSLPQIVDAQIARPLGLTDTAFEVRDAARLAVPYVDGAPRPTRMMDDETVPVPFTPGTGIVFTPSRAFDTTSFPSGGSGMVGSAPEVLRFFERLRRGGDPIVSDASAAQMRRNQNATLPGDAQGPMPGWGFGFGGAVLVDPSAASTPQSPGTWQWGGVYGHSWFVDPQRRLTVVALTNTALEGLYGRFPIDVRDAIYDAL